MSIYEIREKGRQACITKGSNHYKNSGEVEPIELIISVGAGEGFCIGNIIKYAARHKKSKNPTDIIKIADYAHILAGIEKEKEQAKNIKINEIALKEKLEKEVEWNRT